MNIILTLVVLALSCVNLNAEIRDSFEFDGYERSFLVHVPTSAHAASKLPLLLVFHGLTRDGQHMMELSGFNALAEANNFIVVYPDGVSGTWDVKLGPVFTDDVAFVEVLLSYLSARFPVDAQRVYATGFSAGGHLSHRLACELSSSFAAIASVSGTMTDNALDACAPAQSVPVMQIHGTEDSIVPYEGLWKLNSVDKIMTHWASKNNCSQNPRIIAPPDYYLFGQPAVERYLWDSCDNGAELQLLKINGGEHEWPGGATHLKNLVGLQSDLNASQEIWNFVSRFSLH